MKQFITSILFLMLNVCVYADEMYLEFPRYATTPVTKIGIGIVNTDSLIRAAFDIYIPEGFQITDVIPTNRVDDIKSEEIDEGHYRITAFGIGIGRNKLMEVLLEVPVNGEGPFQVYPALTPITGISITNITPEIWYMRQAPTTSINNTLSQNKKPVIYNISRHIKIINGRKVIIRNEQY